MTSTAIDVLGYTAASLVLATFCARSMVTLRVLALCSNVAFVLYAVEASLWPILLLHAAMFPLNLFRLREVLAAEWRFAPASSTFCPHPGRVLALGPATVALLAAPSSAPVKTSRPLPSTPARSRSPWRTTRRHAPRCTRARRRGP